MQGPCDHIGLDDIPVVPSFSWTLTYDPFRRPVFLVPFLSFMAGPVCFKDHLNSIFFILMGKRLPYEPIWINYISILLD